MAASFFSFGRKNRLTGTGLDSHVCKKLFFLSRVYEENYRFVNFKQAQIETSSNCAENPRFFSTSEKDIKFRIIMPRSEILSLMFFRHFFFACCFSQYFKSFFFKLIFDLVLYKDIDFARKNQIFFSSPNPV